MKKLITFFLLILFLKGTEMHSQFFEIDCTGVQISNILELTEGTNDIYFIARMNGSYNIIYSTFHFTYKDGTTSSHYGSINPQGNPIFKLQSNCNNRITDVQVYVHLSGSCSVSKTKDYYPPLCARFDY